MLGTVDEGWSIVQDVMSFERVGIARYARCERLLPPHPRCSATAGTTCPRSCAAAGSECSRTAGGPDCSPIGSSTLQSSGRSARRRRRIPDRGHQAGPGQRRSADGHRRRRPRESDAEPRWFRAEVEDHWRYSQASTVASGSIEMQRILLSRALLAASNDPRPVRRSQRVWRSALRAFEAAGGDELVQRPRPNPTSVGRLSGPVLSELGAWELDPRTDADGLEAAAALCRSAGYGLLPYPVAERLAEPSDLDVDGLIVVADNRPAGCWSASSPVGHSTLGGHRSRVVGHGPPGPGFVGRTRRWQPSTTTGPTTSRSAWCSRAGPCSACWTARWS